MIRSDHSFNRSYHNNWPNEINEREVDELERPHQNHLPYR